MSNSFVTIKLDNGLGENQSNKILVFLLRRYLNGSQDNVSNNYSNYKKHQVISIKVAAQE